MFLNSQTSELSKAFFFMNFVALGGWLLQQKIIKELPNGLQKYITDYAMWASSLGSASIQLLRIIFKRIT